jgi:hypothetical protein
VKVVGAKLEIQKSISEDRSGRVGSNDAAQHATFPRVSVINELTASSDNQSTHAQSEIVAYQRTMAQTAGGNGPDDFTCPVVESPQAKLAIDDGREPFLHTETVASRALTGSTSSPSCKAKPPGVNVVNESNVNLTESQGGRHVAEKKLSMYAASHPTGGSGEKNAVTSIQSLQPTDGDAAVKKDENLCAENVEQIGSPVKISRIKGNNLI